MEVASVLQPSYGSVWRARGVEFAAQLRNAVMGGDDVGITRLLSELLRVNGLTRGQRVAMQLKALQNLLQSLRSMALNDETTGLCNRRGFVQIGTRLLDVAARDQRPVHLIYLHLPQVEFPDAISPSAREVLARQMGNFMRDLFPDYGVYEILGRLSSNEFAALTPNARLASRQAIMQRVRRMRRAQDPVLAVSVGIAHCDPTRPVGIDELLRWAEAAMHVREQIHRTASSGLPPKTPVTLC